MNIDRFKIVRRPSFAMVAFLVVLGALSASVLVATIAAILEVVR